MNILQDLNELQDKEYQKFSKKLCPGVSNIIGVRLPVLRDYAKKIKGKIDIENMPTDYYEEIMLKGMLIGLEKEIDFEKIKNFIPLINNWAVCDTFCIGLKKTNKHKTEMWEFIKKYLNSKNEFYAL